MISKADGGGEEVVVVSNCTVKTTKVILVYRNRAPDMTSEMFSLMNDKCSFVQETRLQFDKFIRTLINFKFHESELQRAFWLMNSSKACVTLE